MDCLIKTYYEDILWYVHKLFSAYFHKLYRIDYKNNVELVSCWILTWNLHVLSSDYYAIHKGCYAAAVEGNLHHVQLLSSAQCAGRAMQCARVHFQFLILQVFKGLTNPINRMHGRIMSLLGVINMSNQH